MQGIDREASLPQRDSEASQVIQTTLAPGAPWPYTYVAPPARKKRRPKVMQYTDPTKHKTCKQAPRGAVSTATRWAVIADLLSRQACTVAEVAQATKLSHSAAVWRLRKLCDMRLVQISNAAAREATPAIPAVYSLTTRGINELGETK